MRGCESRGKGAIPQNLEWRDANSNCLPVFKNTVQNSPKHAFSSENSFFLGRGLVHRIFLPVNPILHPKSPTKLSGSVSAPRIPVRFANMRACMRFWIDNMHVAADTRSSERRQMSPITDNYFQHFSRNFLRLQL